jgi:hypothetical protein
MEQNPRRKTLCDDEHLSVAYDSAWAVRVNALRPFWLY